MRRGKVFVASVSVCRSICLSVRALTFEVDEMETFFLAHWYLSTISRSRSAIKVIGHSSELNVPPASLKSSNTSDFDEI